MLKLIPRLLYGVMAAVTVFFVAVIVFRPAPQVTLTLIPRAPTPTPAPITVYVSGAVNKPLEMITLPPGSRVIDAVKASGGFTTDADLTTLNQAHILADGEQVFVPARPSAGALSIVAPGTAAPGGTISAQPLNINTATQAELEALPNCGPVLAAAIIAYREEHGNFKSFADLDAVKGVGEATLKSWQGLIRFF